MAQHDYNLANATGISFRADLNSMALAIVTVNSNVTEPAVKFPGMLWLDLSGGGDGVMRRRNQANNAWLTDIGIDQTARNAAAAAQATANNALPRTGGTMTGPIVLDGGQPTNNQAMSRTWADTLYQVRLPVPIGGSLLVGAAGGWLNIVNPGSENSLLTTLGGLPTWVSTGVTAAPGVVVRAGSDGTIDSSFIPQVASGLRFCGTFRPAVNFEYPTTGGHGPGGAPAIGDFWVIDGLTTGGYTYLTGSLAGVTVYNGDSIAYNGASGWYRMGSVVNLQGYLKTDGSIAMTGDLNMGGFAVNNVNGVNGRPGTPVPLTNFSIDATNVVISPSQTGSGSLAPMASGRIGTDLVSNQIFVGAGSSNTPMLPVRFFATGASYLVGDFVTTNNAMWRAPQAIAPGAFVSTQWRRVADEDFGTFRVEVVSGANIFRGTGSTVIVGSTTAGGVVLRPNGTTNTAQQFAVTAGGFSWDGNSGWHAGNLSPVTTNTEQTITAFKTITVAPLGTNAGDYKSALTLGTTSANTDLLQMFVTRRIAGNTWDGASWLIRRFVDSNPIGFIDFGGTSTNYALAFGNGTQRRLTLGTDNRWQFDAPITFNGSLNTLSIGPWYTGEGFQIEWNAVTPGGGQNEYTNNYGGGAGGHRFLCRTNATSTGSTVLLVDRNGNATANTFTPTSDERLKDEITATEARDLPLTLYDFVYKASGQRGRSVIAQRVQEVAPERVYSYEGLDGEEYLAVDLMGLALEIALNLQKRVRHIETQLETKAE